MNWWYRMKQVERGQVKLFWKVKQGKGDDIQAHLDPNLLRVSAFSDWKNLIQQGDYVIDCYFLPSLLVILDLLSQRRRKEKRKIDWRRDDYDYDDCSVDFDDYVYDDDVHYGYDAW